MSSHEDSDLRIYVIPMLTPGCEGWVGYLDGGDYDENGDHVSRSAGDPELSQFPGNHWFHYHSDFIDEG